MCREGRKRERERERERDRKVEEEDKQKRISMAHGRTLTTLTPPSQIPKSNNGVTFSNNNFTYHPALSPWPTPMPHQVLVPRRIGGTVFSMGARSRDRCASTRSAAVIAAAITTAAAIVITPDG